MNKKLIIIFGALAAGIALGLIIVSKQNQSQPENGNKTIQVDVVHADGSTTSYEYTTSDEFLGPFLEQEGLISGSDSQFGLYVDTVDGQKADYDQNQAYWKLQVNAQDSQTGADEVVLKDGDIYTWIYTAQ